MLNIVPTPIGNLEDITLRSLKVLENTDFIIAENPLVSGKLLKLLNLPKKEYIQMADFNEDKSLDYIIKKLKTQNGVLLSDAGTPCISDPGFKLINRCYKENIVVDSLPGPTSIICALAGSGMPTNIFTFVGFLPKTENKLNQIINSYLPQTGSLIAFESPERLMKTFKILDKTYPDLQCTVARELTKLHQEYIKGTCTEVFQKLNKKPSIKGEIVVLLSH